MFSDEDKRQDELMLHKNVKAAIFSVVILTILIALNLFCALTPFNLELVAILFGTIFLFVYVKFVVICSELKDLGYTGLWLTLYKTLGLAIYLISAVLCMLGIG